MWPGEMVEISGLVELPVVELTGADCNIGLHMHIGAHRCRNVFTSEKLSLEKKVCRLDFRDSSDVTSALRPVVACPRNHV